MENNLIELDNCGVVRNQKWLVRGVSLKVSQGEIVTLIGPNGSGKSTTAKMCLNILKPDEGFNTIKDDIRISYVPQKISICLLYTSPSPRDMRRSRMPSSA